METNDAQRQLHEVERLRGATLGESLRAPRWAFPLLGSAIVGFLVAAALGPQWFVGWLSLAWTLFIVGWAVWIRRANRAHAPMPWRAMRPYLYMAIGIGIAANAAYLAFGRMSWLALGAAFGLWGLFTGVHASRRRPV